MLAPRGDAGRDDTLEVIRRVDGRVLRKHGATHVCTSTTLFLPHAKMLRPRKITGVCRLAVWPSGRPAVRPSGPSAVWPPGRLAVWPSGRLAVRPVDRPAAPPCQTAGQLDVQAAGRPGGEEAGRPGGWVAYQPGSRAARWPGGRPVDWVGPCQFHASSIPVPYQFHTSSIPVPNPVPNPHLYVNLSFRAQMALLRRIEEYLLENILLV